MSEISWPQYRPTVIKNFPFQAQIALLFRSGDTPDKAMEIAISIHDRYCVGDFLTAFQSLLNCMYTVDAIKIKTLGQNGSTNQSNILIQYMADIFVGRRNLEPTQIARIERIRDQSTDQIGLEGWYHAKMFNMALRANFMRGAREYVAGLYVPRALMSLTSIQKITSDTGRLANQVMSELHRLRAYGVKSSYFADNIMHGPTQAWVMVDPIDLITAVPSLRTQMGDTTVFVALADRRSITSLEIQPINEANGSWKRSGMVIDFATYFTWSLAANGELYFTGARHALPVRDIFAAQGREHFYELVRLSLVLRAYDLVVPIDRVSILPALPRVARGLKIVSAVKSLVAPKPLFTPELIVPRIRLLEHPDELRRALEQEIDRANDETAHRTKRLHDVTAHIRRLPTGHKPSGKSRAHALEYGITLKDNETFVKKHERGAGEKVQATRARHREGFGPR